MSRRHCRISFAETERELREKRRIEHSADAFFAALFEKAAALDALFSRRARWDIRSFMQKRLDPIDERLCWEFGPAVKGGQHRLVVTPEAERQLRPLVECVISRAPRRSGGFELYSYRLAEPLAMVRANLQARVNVDLSRLSRVRVSRGRHGRVDLAFFMPDLDQQTTRSAGFVAAEGLLGEETLDVWIGSIEAERRASKKSIPLADLPKAVARAIRARRKELRPRPYCLAAPRSYSALQRKVPVQSAYPGRSDLFLITTCAPEIEIAALEEESFDSARFSRHGEIFAYVKIDALGGLGPSRVDDRAGIEDAVDRVLAAKGLGRAVGGGTGHRYSYLSVALMPPLPKSVKALRRALAELRLPKHTWILFHDATLANEWVGVYPATPPPPAVEW